ncbi:MAG: hypothetical protein HQ494_01080 [Rhodospirillales bacterium]|nr:hypothetical protein [Rhodospirillales bacterium]
MSVQTEWGYCCPICLDDTGLEISIITGALLHEGGTDTDLAQNHDHEWGDQSAVFCHHCGRAGHMGDCSVKDWPGIHKMLVEALIDEYEESGPEELSEYAANLGAIRDALNSAGFSVTTPFETSPEGRNAWIREVHDLVNQAIADQKNVGNGSTPTLRNMVAALRLHPHNNTPQEMARLESAKRILAHGRQAQALKDAGLLPK